MLDRVVITGIGAVTAGGLDSGSTIAAAEAGHPAWQLCSSWEYDEIGKIPFGAVPDFDRSLVLPFLRPPFPSRYCQLAMLAAGEAVADASLTSLDGERVGTVIGSEFGPNKMISDYLNAVIIGGPGAASPLRFAATVANVSVGLLAKTWKFGGPSTLICGEQPALYAYDLLREGRADAILCGGVDETRDPQVWSFLRAGVLATGSTCVGSTRVHDSRSTGLVLGEGAAFLVLERRASALARGARIYGELLGASARQDPTADSFLSVRSHLPITGTMTDALRRAGVRADEVELVVAGANAHPGTGHAETAALRQLWGKALPRTIAIKDMTGEIMGASGPLALLVGLTARHPASGGSAQEPQLRLVNSFHIGGAGSSVVIRTAPGRRSA